MSPLSHANHAPAAEDPTTATADQIVCEAQNGLAPSSSFTFKKSTLITNLLCDEKLG
jgi:hypothetical protein